MLSVDQLEDKLIDLAFAEDIGDGDHTTLCCIPHLGTFAHSTYNNISLFSYLQRFSLHFGLVAPVYRLAEFAVLL